jgi:hypothetical protein
MPYKNAQSEYQSNYNKQRCADDPDYAERQRSAKLISYHKNKLKGGKSKYDRRKEAGLCPRCGKAETGGDSCEKCLAVQRAANQKYFDLIYDHYGRVCKCCGETEAVFLTLDHVNRDGAEQRRSTSGKNVGGGSNWRFYMVRKAQKWQGGQTL